MSTPLRLNSWLVSPYSAKVRAYLRFKQLPFEDRAPSIWALRGRIRQAVGKAIMPTVELPDGTWLQDSSEIIDTLEASEGGVEITPPGPRQRLVSALLELHADEWLTIPAMHYRWNTPENAAFALAEFGRCGLPGLPGPLARLLARPVAKKMASYVPILGVDEATRGGVEAFTKQLIARLDAHLEQHPFLLGSRPCLADFALFATPWSHLFRDPGTTRLLDARPHVRGWFGRLNEPDGEPGEFLPDDAIPDTLLPILRTMLAEQGEYVRRLIDAIDAWCDEHPGAARVPRSLGNTPFTVGGAQGERRLLTEGLWMIQRPLDAATPESLAWVRGLGPLDWAPRHRVVRRNFAVVLAH